MSKSVRAGPPAALLKETRRLKGKRVEYQATRRGKRKRAYEHRLEDRAPQAGKIQMLEHAHDLLTADRLNGLRLRKHRTDLVGGRQDDRNGNGVGKHGRDRCRDQISGKGRCEKDGENDMQTEERR